MASTLPAKPGGERAQSQIRARETDPWLDSVQRLDHWAHSLSLGTTDPSLNLRVAAVVTLGDRIEALWNRLAFGRAATASPLVAASRPSLHQEALAGRQKSLSDHKYPASAERDRFSGERQPRRSKLTLRLRPRTTSAAPPQPVDHAKTALDRMLTSLDCSLGDLSLNTAPSPLPAFHTNCSSMTDNGWIGRAADTLPASQQPSRRASPRRARALRKSRNSLGMSLGVSLDSTLLSSYNSQSVCVARSSSSSSSHGALEEPVRSRGDSMSSLHCSRLWELRRDAALGDGQVLRRTARFSASSFGSSDEALAHSGDGESGVGSDEECVLYA
jgi:hypothetical protein